MVKSIIKRIVVGVGVALVLMALSKYGLIANAYALTTEQSEVDFISYNIPNYNNGAIQTASYSNLVSFDVSGYVNTPFKGVYARNANNNNYGFFRFRFQNANLSSNSFSNDILNKKISLSFLIYANMQSQQSIPVRVWIGDSTGRIYACDSQSSYNVRASADTGTNNVIGMLIPVTCSDIRLSNKNINVYIGDQLFPLGSGATDNLIGISKMTAWSVSDEEKTISAINETTQAVDNMNDTLNNSSTDDPSGDISNMSNKNASNGSITQLLTLPITLYQSILNSVSGSCSSFNLGTLFSHQIVLPCINLSNLLGSTLYGIIDILISGLFILSFRKKMVDIFNHMTSLNDRGNELE